MFECNRGETIDSKEIFSFDLHEEDYLRSMCRKHVDQLDFHIDQVEERYMTSETINQQ